MLLLVYIQLEVKGFPGGSVVKNQPANSGNTSLIPGSGRSPGKGNGNPLQYSRQEDPRGRGRSLAGLQSMGPQRVRHAWVRVHTRDLCDYMSIKDL